MLVCKTYTHLGLQGLSPPLYQGLVDIIPIWKFFFLVPPLISVQNQHVAAAVNRSTLFECEVEAFPYAIHYWEREGDILENSDKYSITRVDVSNYKFIMQLNISLISDADNGTYYCVSKNDEAIVAGNITLYSKLII